MNVIARKTVCCIITLPLVCVIAGAAFCEETAVPSVDDVISHIAAAERALVNVRIKAEAFEERRMSSADPWESTRVYARSTSWYNGLLKSKARADMASEILKWEDGLAPYAEESYAVGFDGQTGRSVRHMAGPPGSTQPVKTAEILPTPPSELRTGWRGFATGIALSLNGLFAGEDLSTSELLRSVQEVGTPIDVSREKYQDADCVKVSTAGGLLVMWLDLERGYALRGCEKYRAPNVLSTVDIVSKLTEAAPGVWFPAEASRTIFPNAPDQPQLRMVYTSSEVVANDPHFDEAIYEVPIPDDYLVHDRIRGVQYQKSIPKEVIQRELDNVVAAVVDGTSKDAPSATGEQTAVDDHQGVKRSEDPATESPVVAQGGSAVWPFLGLVAGGVAVGASVLLIRRKSSRAVMMLCFLLACPPALRLHAAEDANTVFMHALGRPPKQDTNLNCGLNAVYITLKCFGDGCSVQQLTDELELSGNFVRNLSLHEIASCLRLHGMEVKGLKADTPDLVLRYATADNILIVHEIRTIGQERYGHYLTLKKEGNRLWVLDPPFTPVTFTSEEILQNHSLTGHFLTVSTLPSSIELDKTMIELGTIPNTERIIRATLTFRNKGQGVLRITDAKGDCSCFGGYGGTTEVQPGGTGELELRFKKERMHGGHNNRRALLITNDPEHGRIPIRLHCFIQMIPEPNDIRVLPQTIDYGRAYQDAIAGKQVDIVVWVPEAENDETHDVQASADIPSLRITRISNELGELNGASMRTITHRVSWQTPPRDGAFAGVIQLTVSGGQVNGTVLSVPVRGEAVPTPLKRGE